jgi:hypothetical protein
MIPPTLSPMERAAVRAARTMTREDYAGSSAVARDGKTYLFAAGSAEAFESLWAQAEALRVEVASA